MKPEPSQTPSPGPEAAPASFLKVLGAVFSSFFGVRKRSAGERDAMTIKLHHVIIAGLLGAAMLVAAVATLVTFITRKG